MSPVDPNEIVDCYCGNAEPDENGKLVWDGCTRAQREECTAFFTKESTHEAVPVTQSRRPVS